MGKNKFKALFDFVTKSKIKAREGKLEGQYPFYTSSKELNKYIDKTQHNVEALIFGTGGTASIHYANGEFATSTDCFVVIAKENTFLMKYAYYFFIANLHILEHGFKGAGLKHISKKYIQEIELPIINKGKQKDIIRILDQVQVLINLRKESIQKLDYLIESIFMEMFVNNSEYENWEIKKIEELVLEKKGSMRTGPFGSDLLHSEFIDNGKVSVLGIDNAVNNKFMWIKKRYITEEKYEKLKNYTIYPRDVIITIMGTVGRTAVIPDEIPLSINTKHLAALSFDQDSINSYFIAHSLRLDPKIIGQIKNKTRGALMDGLNLTIIKKLSLALPPKDLQDNFERKLKKIEEQKSLYEQELEKLEESFQALLQQSFKE